MKKDKMKKIEIYCIIYLEEFYKGEKNMRGIYTTLKELTENVKLKLRLTEINNVEIFDNLPLSESNICRKIKIKDKLYLIYLEKDDIKALPLIEYILNKSDIENNIIERILDEKIQWSSLEESAINRAGKMILIESEKIDEVLEIVRETYLDEEIYIGKIYDRIIIIGNIDYEDEYANSLKETILQNIAVKAKISISYLDGSYKGFKKGYKDAILALKIGNKLKIKPEIYYLDKMYLEKSIYNLKEEYLDELKEEYKDTFKGFNHELFQTLKEMLKCNLSLTKAAKNLFIHRNTLMYRIEKIKKETGFDIRDFKEATFLYIIYLNSNR